jgi:hypothetical protein
LKFAPGAMADLAEGPMRAISPAEAAILAAGFAI